MASCRLIFYVLLTDIAVTRILVANEYELEQMEIKSNDQMISIRNEMTTLKILHDLMQQKLGMLVSCRRESDGSEECRLASTYRDGQVRVLEASIQTLISKGRELIQPTCDMQGVYSIFFTLEHPTIDLDYLEKLGENQLGFEQEVSMNVCAIKYSSPPTVSTSTLGDTVEDYKDYFNSEIKPILDQEPDLFPKDRFNLDSTLNMACVQNAHGAYYDFNWLGIDYENEGIFMSKI
jgi:hypothetical protein